MEPFNAAISLPFPYTFTTNAAALGLTASISASSSTFSNALNRASPWMDSRIWSRLSQTLIHRVLAFLPLPAFFRARSVCKRWYALLFSETFVELYLEISPRRPCFIFFKHGSLKTYIYRNSNSNTTDSAIQNRANPYEGYVFDPQEFTWYRLSFPLIPSGFFPGSSSGGLICWVSDEAGPKSLILCNPLVGSSLTPLPAPTFRHRLFPSIGLAVGETSIDVTVAGDDLISPYAVKNLTSESFHVDAGGFFSLWATTAALPRLCSLESGHMVHVGGRFYCMNYSPFSVLTYDVAVNDWRKIQAPMRRFLRSPSLVECGGKLVLVAAVEKSKLNVPKSLRLWSLQPGGGTSWVEIERMPQQLYVEFEEMEGGRGFDCVGNGEFVVVMARGSSRTGGLMFDMWGKQWQWIPPCPFFYSNDDGFNAASRGGGDGGGVELHGFPYEPRLSTPVTGILDQLTLPFQNFGAN